MVILLSLSIVSYISLLKIAINCGSRPSSMENILILKLKLIPTLILLNANGDITFTIGVSRVVKIAINCGSRPSRASRANWSRRPLLLSLSCNQTVWFPEYFYDSKMNLFQVSSAFILFRDVLWVSSLRKTQVSWDLVMNVCAIMALPWQCWQSVSSITFSPIFIRGKKTYFSPRTENVFLLREKKTYFSPSSLVCIALHCIALHCTALHCIAHSA